MNDNTLESRGALKVLNVPKTDDDIGERLNAYQNTRSASFQGFSRINDGIFINTRFGESSQVIKRFLNRISFRKRYTFDIDYIKNDLLIMSNKNIEILVTYIMNQISGSFCCHSNGYAKAAYFRKGTYFELWRRRKKEPFSCSADLSPENGSWK